MSQTTLERPAEPERPYWTVRRLRVAVLAIGGLLVLAAAPFFLTTGGTPEAPPSPVPVAWARPPVDDAQLLLKTGVKITQVSVTGGGGLVDLRFQVIIPDTAHALHDPAHPPAIVDEDTGLVVHELFMGHSHTAPFRQGAIYYFVFSDPVNWVHRGDKVTVLLGDAQVEHVVVK